jgi:DNA (cytosine-5)-methyltransferase 1
MLRVLSLFSGIGGFDLGLERTGGFRTVAFCEIDAFCRAVLAQHWPLVPCYDDVRGLTAERLRADGIAVDVIVGGFPCQDVSAAGKGRGLDGERSGLWFEFARLVGELRPRYAIVENVSALLGRGFDRVLGSLATLGYDAEWHCIPAAAVGAPHRRDRVWIIAHIQTDAQRSDANGVRPHHPPMHEQGVAVELRHEQVGDAEPVGYDVADADGEPRREGRQGDAAQGSRGRNADRGGVGAGLADAGGAGLPAPKREILCPARWREERRAAAECGWWAVEPDVGRVAHGIPARVDRLRSLGNAVVPQIPEVIGNAILDAEVRP